MRTTAPKPETRPEPKAPKRPSVFDTIIEKGQENAARLEETFSGPVVELATSYVRPNPNNPRKRISQASVDEMANAIRQVGEILQPLLVRPVPHGEDGSRYEVVCGDRRLLGARQVELKKIPVRVRELSDEEAARFALWENLARRDLDAMDVADSVNRLRHIDKLTWPDLAARFGVSKQWVWKLQKMAELPEPVKEMVRDKTLSAYSATLLTQLPSSEADVVGLAREIVERKLSTREVERLLESRRGGAAPGGAEDRKGAFTVSWTPPPGADSRRYGRALRAADDLAASLQDGRIPPELARAMRPVAQALLELGDRDTGQRPGGEGGAAPPDPGRHEAPHDAQDRQHRHSAQKHSTQIKAEGPG